MGIGKVKRLLSRSVLRQFGRRWRASAGTRLIYAEDVREQARLDIDRRVWRRDIGLGRDASPGSGKWSIRRLLCWYEDRLWTANQGFGQPLWRRTREIEMYRLREKAAKCHELVDKTARHSHPW